MGGQEKNRCFLSHDEQKYMVNEDYFCFVPLCSSMKTYKKALKVLLNQEAKKVQYLTSLTTMHLQLTIKNNLRRIDMSSRLLQGQICYGSLNTKYSEQCLTVC